MLIGNPYVTLPISFRFLSYLPCLPKTATSAPTTPPQTPTKPSGGIVLALPLPTLASPTFLLTTAPTDFEENSASLRAGTARTSTRATTSRTWHTLSAASRDLARVRIRRGLLPFSTRSCTFAFLPFNASLLPAAPDTDSRLRAGGASTPSTRTVRKR
jgi:hypothetical protein